MSTPDRHIAAAQQLAAQAEDEDSSTAQRNAALLAQAHAQIATAMVLNDSTTLGGQLSILVNEEEQ